MLDMYVSEGVWYLMSFVPFAFIVILIFHTIKSLIKRSFDFKPLGMLAEFAWLVMILSILTITGIIGGEFGATSIFDGNVNYSFALFEEGLTMATILNFVLFIPFGFLSAIVFKKLRNKWIYGIIFGFMVSSIIEFLQTFFGRFVQLDDILMNTFGTFIGYLIIVFILKVKDKIRDKKLNYI